MRNRICFFVGSLEAGGTERYLLRFLDYSKGSLDATVFCKSGMKGSLESDFEKLKIKIVAKKLGYINLSRYWTLYKFLCNNHFDAVCDMTGNFAGIPIFLSKLCGITKRISFYRLSTDHFQSSTLKKIYNRFVNFLVKHNATDILANSQSAFYYFFPNLISNDNRFKIIRNGIDINKFTGKYNKIVLRRQNNIPVDSFIVGHTGRYNVAKNFPFILKVAKIVCSKYDNVRFVLCGRNTDSNELLSHIQKYGLNDKIIILGYRNDIPQVLSMYDVFFFPSITEGQPNSLIEAMVMGLPFVASNIEPIKEAVPIEAQHLLVDPGQPIYAAEKLVEIMNSELAANNHSIWAKKNFDSNKRFKEFEEILLK